MDAGNLPVSVVCLVFCAQLGTVHHFEGATLVRFNSTINIVVIVPSVRHAETIFSRYKSYSNGDRHIFVDLDLLVQKDISHLIFDICLYINCLTPLWIWFSTDRERVNHCELILDHGDRIDAKAKKWNVSLRNEWHSIILMIFFDVVHWPIEWVDRVEALPHFHWVFSFKAE